MKNDPMFPERLARLMEDNNVTKSDLARLMWGTIVDERGYDVPKNRQSIGKYLAGKATPTHKTIRLMADALKVNVGELDPGYNPISRLGSGVKIFTKSPKISHLEISLEVPTPLALKIIEDVSPYAK